MKRFGFNILAGLIVVLFCSSSLFAQSQLYRIKQIRAAPGELLNVIELVKSDIAGHKKLGIEKPYLMRHSQGDQWDLLLIFPVKSIADDQANKESDISNTLAKPFGDSYYTKVSWEQEGYVYGPAVAEFTKSFDEYSYYHVEIFTSLAGKQSELRNQREMENVYLNEIKRRPNHIYTRAFGPSWDIFTIGFYKDIKDYAASADIPAADKERAAKKAGFQGTSTIGSYLRELILEHHDTLAGAVRVE